MFNSKLKILFNSLPKVDKRVPLPQPVIPLQTQQLQR
jgi:hypothetical protein